jgi:hypothetical protein
MMVVMDMGGMDVEDLQRRWRRARRAWDDVRQVKLGRDVAGERLSDEERARWDDARAEFQAVEDLWDQAYRAGVVVVVGGDDDGDSGRADPEGLCGC